MTTKLGKKYNETKATLASEGVGGRVARVSMSRVTTSGGVVSFFYIDFEEGALVAVGYEKGVDI